MHFTYGGSSNDNVIDQDEAEILADLLIRYMKDRSKWGSYLDEIIQHSKSDNLDSISKSIYRTNLSDSYESAGYSLAKAIAQVNDSDDNESDKLVPAYQTLMKYKDNANYSTAVSKLAAKLTTGRKIDTIADHLGVSRESIRQILSKIS